MGTVDVYRMTDQLDDGTLDVLVNRLEARGKHPRFVGGCACCGACAAQCECRGARR